MHSRSECSTFLRVEHSLRECMFGSDSWLDVFPTRLDSERALAERVLYFPERARRRRQAYVDKNPTPNNAVTKLVGSGESSGGSPGSPGGSPLPVGGGGGSPSPVG